MSPKSSDISPAKDTLIADALAASSPAINQSVTDAEVNKAELTEEERLKKADAAKKALAMQEFAKAMLKRMTRHNTPFDGRKRATKKAKSKANRKANKKRKLYVRYGK